VAVILAATVMMPAGFTLAQDTHSAVTPQPRSGGPMERHESFNRLVKERQGQVDLVFIGDSITQGWEGNGKSTWEHYYGDRKALNLGIGGDRTQHVLWRLDHGNVEGISPRVAVVMIGTNNSADDRNTAGEMVDGVQAVIDSIQEKLPETRILLLGIFPRGREFNDQRGKILQVNQVIRKMASRSGVSWLDIGHHFIDGEGRIPPTIMPDALHLSPIGYEIWAEAIEGRLAGMLNQPSKSPRKSRAAGEWTWSMPGPDGRMVDAALTATLDGHTLRGSIRFPQGRSFEFQDGYAVGPFLGFHLDRIRPNGESITYRMSAEISPDGDGQSMNGTVRTRLEGENMDADWKATRD
jgi:beta-glucosidase